MAFSPTWVALCSIPPIIPRFVSARHIQYLVARGFMKFPDIDRRVIWDKNKADGFARFLTSFQVLWFAIQCIGRAIQRLPISTFELDTVAFVLCTFPTFFFWRHKPLDAATTIALPLNEGVQMRDILISAGESASESFKLTPLDFVDPPPHPYETLDPIMWAMQYLFGLGADSKHVPINTFKNTARTNPERISVIDFMAGSVVAVAYISIHLIAWNFTFLTPVERNLWRCAALILLGSACSYGTLLLIVTWQLPLFCRLFGMVRVRTATEMFERMHPINQYMIAGSWVGSYGLARLYVIVEAFVNLRALPADTYNDVNWSDFFPHI